MEMLILLSFELISPTRLCVADLGLPRRVEEFGNEIIDFRSLVFLPLVIGSTVRCLPIVLLDTNF